MKGKVTAITLAVLMSTVSLSAILMPVVSGGISGESPFAGGTGVPGDPYIIVNVNELQSMFNDTTAHYALGNDIDASATAVWNWSVDHFEGFMPVGDAVTGFTGSLEGNGYNITGLFINRSGMNMVGLFGDIDAGVFIANLSLVSCDITGARVTGAIVGYNEGNITNTNASGSVFGTMGTIGNFGVGGIVGINYGVIRECAVLANVHGIGLNVGGLAGYQDTGSAIDCVVLGNVSGNGDYIGGLVGTNEGPITNCTVYAEVNGTGQDNIGGLVGENWGPITNSSAHGEVIGTISGAVGGLIGNADTGSSVNGCLASGNVTCSGDYVGGLVGWMKAGTLNNSYSTGKLVLTGGSGHGGLVGQADGGSIAFCNATGDVEGIIYVGGLIGSNVADVYGCSADGKVNGTGDYVGGLIGYNTGLVNMSYATGDVGSTGGTGHGGLIGYTTGGLVTLSYAVGDVYGVENVGGLCGYSFNEISQSFAIGEVNATSNNVGGLVGYKDGSSIQDCYARGNVSGVQGIGGLVGWNKGSIAYSYSTGNATGSLNVGGFLGERQTGIGTFCYYDNETSGTEIAVGSGVFTGVFGNYTAQMMQQANFVTWNFTSIWGINETTSYPFLLAFVPPATADLEITVVDSADPVMVSDTLHYYVTVTNHGSINATDVNATIHLPAEVLHMSTNQTTTFWGLGNISWEIGNMTPGQIVFWDIEVTVLANGILNCTVDVSASSYDAGVYPNDDHELTATNQAPVAVNDTPTILEDSGANTIDVLANDNDPDAGDAITIIGITQGTDGTVVITNGGADLTYEPNADFNGVDSFTYTIEDLEGVTDTATVTVTVTNVNDAPDAVDDTATVVENGGIIYIDVLANDGDVDLDSLTLDAVTQGTNGTVMLEAGNVSYTPDTGFSGTDSFTYTIIDGNGGSDTATVNVTVTNTNDAPVAVDDTATVLEDSNATTIEVLDNDSDADGDTLTITAITQPANGVASITDSTNVTYLPDPDFFGTDSFNYTIADGNGNTDIGTVTVDVTNVNDVPVIETFTVPDGTIGEEYDLVIGVIDVDNDTLVMGVSITTADSGLTIGSNVFTSSFIIGGTPTVNGTSMVHLEVDDGNGGIASIFFNITVGSGIPDPVDNTTTDTDGDGVPDDEDDFPDDPAASVDTDGDGLPDEWNDGYTADDSTSGLVIDEDDDNDGTPDIDDDTPTGDDDDTPTGDDDPADDDAEGEGSILDYWWILLIIVIVLVLILILGRKKKDDEEEVPEEPVEDDTPADDEE